MNSSFMDRRYNKVTAMAEEKRKNISLPEAVIPSNPGVLLESLAAIEHQKWCRWAQSALERESISEETRSRWHRFFIPYDELPEEIKEYSRNNARQVLDFLASFFTNQK